MEYFIIINNPKSLIYELSQMSIEETISIVKKNIVFIGKEIIDPLSNDPKYAFIGTGFIAEINKIYHIITARHVVLNPNTKQFDDDLIIFFNKKSGNIGSRKIEDIKNRIQVNWITHTNDNIDIAIIPFGFNPDEDDISLIPEDMLLNFNNLRELYDVYYLSYQPNIKIGDKVTPIIRTGTISLLNDDKTLYLDGQVFPGNSGSPVFIKPVPFSFNESGMVIGSNPHNNKLIGLIGEYVPYQDVAYSKQTGRVRVVFEENTGLSKVWSVDLILEIIESDSFKEQIERIPHKK